MDTQTLTDDVRAEQRVSNRLMMRLSRILGLTTGVGVVAWGAWSLVVTVGMTVYERTGLTAAEIAIEDSLNQGMLQSALLIAVGVVILELRRIEGTLSGLGNTRG